MRQNIQIDLLSHVSLDLPWVGKSKTRQNLHVRTLLENL